MTKLALGKFELCEAQIGERWDEYVERSPQGTIFSQSDYLTCSLAPFRIFTVLKGKEQKGAVVLNFNESGQSALADYVIHNGLLFNKPDPGVRRSSLISEEFEIAEFVISQLVALNRGVVMRLSPEVKDIRPFLWYNYHSHDPETKFRTYVYYTSYVDISAILDGPDADTETFKNLGHSRRQEIRYALKADCRAYECTNIDTFLDLYATTMWPDHPPSGHEGNRLQSIRLTITTFTEKNRGRLFLIDNKHGDTVGGAFFVYDSKRAYYLYGANHPQRQERYTGSKIVWDAFKRLRQLGIREVDMEGVNSPGRGWFKVSFGGDLRSYYYVALAPQRGAA